jgi:Domain of Unknown Function (DUF1206)
MAAGRQTVVDQRPVDAVARVGYAVSGVLHLLIGWLAAQTALGGGGQSADQSGALAQIASQPFGRVLLWGGVAGFLALGLLYLSQLAWGSPRGADRLKAGGKGVVYLALAWTTFGFARGSGGSSSSQQSRDVTAKLLGLPGGRLVVALIGLAVVGVGVYHVVKGWKRKFLRDLQGGTEGQLGHAVVTTAIVGYVAKGIALALVGALFVVAAAKQNPSEATGLDGALHTLREQPFGVALLLVIAAGLAAFGVYSFARARFGRLPR